MYSVSTESSSILKYHQESRINSNQEIGSVRETEESAYKKRLKLLSEDQKSIFALGCQKPVATWLKTECDWDQGVPLNLLIFSLVFQWLILETIGKLRTFIRLFVILGVLFRWQFMAGKRKPSSELVRVNC